MSISGLSERMMTNEKVVRNFILNKNHYNIFPLAAIFGPTIYRPPDYASPKFRGAIYGGTKYGRQGKNVIMIFIQNKIPNNFLIGHHPL